MRARRTAVVQAHLRSISTAPFFSIVSPAANDRCAIQSYDGRFAPRCALSPRPGNRGARRGAANGLAAAALGGNIDMQRIGATSSQASSNNAAFENDVGRDAADNPTHAARSPVLDNLRPRRESRGADRDEGGSSSQTMHPAIARARLPLAGYLYARASIRRTIDAQDAASLTAAQDTLTETRAILRKGRGNVINDNEKTNFDAAGRSLAALEGERMLRSVLQNGAKDEVGLRLSNTLPREEVMGLTGGVEGRIANIGCSMALAAGSIVNESGYCDAHAYASIVTHAPKIKGGEMLTIVGSDLPFPHTWANLDRRRGAGQQVILDAWAEGPAVLAEDSRRQGPHVAVNPPPQQVGNGGHPVIIGDVTLDLALSQANARLFARGVGKMAHAMQNDRRIMRTLKEIARRTASEWAAFASRPGVNFEQVGGAYSPMPVLGDAFVQAVKEAETRPRRQTDQPAQVMVDIRAAGVARHFGLDVRAATRDAAIGEIKDASKALLDDAARRG